MKKIIEHWYGKLYKLSNIDIKQLTNSDLRNHAIQKHKTYKTLTSLSVKQSKENQPLQGHKTNNQLENNPTTNGDNTRKQE